MSIIERSKVVEAYIRARCLGADHDAACATVAQALALPIEAVQDVMVMHDAEVPL